MNSELEKFIDLILIDGVITEKERQVLYKKAQELGVDEDELEVVLESKLFAINKNKGNTTKHGELKRCPSCNAPINKLTAFCPDCGHEFMNIEATGSVQKLYNDLQMVEREERNRPKSSKNGNSVFELLMGEDEDEYDDRLSEKIFQRKISIVSMFPVPNTKTDILEFLSLAVSEGSKKKGGFFSSMTQEEKNYINVWISKAEQVIFKARLMLKDDKNLLAEINNYAYKLKIK